MKKICLSKQKLEKTKTQWAVQGVVKEQSPEWDEAVSVVMGRYDKGKNETVLSCVTYSRSSQLKTPENYLKISIHTYRPTPLLHQSLQFLQNFQVEFEEEADQQSPLELHLATRSRTHEGDLIQKQPASLIQHQLIPAPGRVGSNRESVRGQSPSCDIMWWMAVSDTSETSVTFGGRELRNHPIKPLRKTKDWGDCVECSKDESWLKMGAISLQHWPWTLWNRLEQDRTGYQRNIALGSIMNKSGLKTWMLRKKLGVPHNGNLGCCPMDACSSVDQHLKMIAWGGRGTEKPHPGWPQAGSFGLDSSHKDGIQWTEVKWGLTPSARLQRE